MVTRSLGSHFIQGKIMLTVRIDDILGTSSQWQGRRNPPYRFAQISRWLAQTENITHMPTIVVQEIKSWPETINLIRDEAAEGRMSPQIHGWQHIDYNKLGEAEIERHLDQCLEWFSRELSYRPCIWATPWGAESPKLTHCASKFSLEIQGVKKVATPGGFIEWSKTHNVNDWDSSIPAFCHWWNRGNRLLKIVEIVKYGSYREATKQRPDLF
jgi:hypothetical protein